MPFNQNDLNLLRELYNTDQFDLDILKDNITRIHDLTPKKKLSKFLELNDYLTELSKDLNVVFSLANLEGAGHYSGLHYRIYVNNDILIVDGGRIDTLCNKFNSSQNIPGLCMV